MSKNYVSIDKMADEVMKSLTDYAELTTESMKQAVNNAAKTVKQEIQTNAPKKTGAYKKSWSIKKTVQGNRKLEVTVYSRTKYHLAHLLEHGHANRSGGRTRAFPHIAPAEEIGIRQLEEELTRSLKP